ncbi:hypothetical protein PFISCL1PPCAC_23997 [Pristionchus fissidentatus]|uniref:Importin subunit alpha n=1 Tax=Pristionchus fissidentatus TaxID=1538716 RepID=A0AAV5WQA9_9BILA|nr:hypothetical protein PFISCL1PPCAC_23997 [Pristionchus fissidentatus]
MKTKRRSSGALNQTLEQEYDYFAGLLTNEESTKMAQASAVNYFRRLFTENTEPPKYFDHSLIDNLIEIVRDAEKAADIRTDAAWAITNLLCSKRTPLTHEIIKKGALTVFVWCIKTGEYKLRDQCIWGIGNISADCSQCKDTVRSTDVLDVIAKQMHSGVFLSKESSRCAIWCCLNILRGANAPISPRTARLLLTAITKSMHRFESDGNIITDSLLTLSLLADDRNFFHFPHLWPIQIDAMINEPGLITCTLAAIETGCAPLVSPALRLIGNIITGTDEQTEKVITRDGFIKLIFFALDSPVGQVRREAAWILSNIAAGPPTHVNLIIQDNELISKLMFLLRKDDSRLQKEVCWVFANVLSSLNTTPRPKLQEEILGHGVLAIIQFAMRPGTDVRLVNKIREVLSILLISHPQYWPVVEEACAGQTPLLDPPRRSKYPCDYVIYPEDAMEI